MQKVSLNKDTQLLIDSFFKVKTKKNLTKFIEDLFSPEETLDLAQRLKIAKLILDGKTYEEIAAEIPVSTSTISKIIDNGSVNFGKSITDNDPCNIYFITGRDEFENLELQIENCDSIATIQNVRFLE